MTSPIRLTSLRFNGGDVVDTSEADVVVLVGPNNAGKSRTLGETQQRLSLAHGAPEPLNAFFVLDDVRLSPQVDATELEAWLTTHRHSWEDPSSRDSRIRTIGTADLSLRKLSQLWSNAATDGRLGQLAPHLVRSLYCGERLGYLGAPQRLDPGTHPEHPVQWLVRDADRLSAFRQAIMQAFGWNVIVDAWGQNIYLRLSRAETQQDFASQTENGLPSEELVERLARLPLIEHQSDGVRSFAGILLTLLTMPYGLILLDEPEAFLHPPQARLLGRNLRSVQLDGQLLVATHSLDVLLGLVEAGPEGVLIVRLTRDGDRTFAQTLPPDELARLWADPLLRFSRALDGIFHDGVVVCEGDTDSQFYSAVSTLVAEEQGHAHIMFTYAGSKHRIPLITNALRGLGVPVRAIVDFDALRDQATVRALVEGLGGTFTESIDRNRSVVDAQLRGSTATPTVQQAATEIARLLTDKDAGVVTPELRREINSHLVGTSGWQQAKRSGQSAVPSGDATIALRHLLEELVAAGLFVVPGGEVESFVREVPGKGPKWVVEVVEQGKLGTATAAGDFVRDVLESIG